MNFTISAAIHHAPHNTLCTGPVKNGRVIYLQTLKNVSKKHLKKTLALMIVSS
jgi:hypothetical protein